MLKDVEQHFWLLIHRVDIDNEVHESDEINEKSPRVILSELREKRGENVTISTSEH